MNADSRVGSYARRFAAILCILASFAAKPIWAKLPGHNYRILNSAGKRIFSVFDGLPPSPRDYSYRYLTAAARSCPPLTAGAETQAERTGSPSLRTISTRGQQKGRYLTVQSDCGGHYAACYEEFCTIYCEYQLCYAGGSNYYLGWQTGYWNGCCYGDVQCINDNIH